ncbi:MAG: V-type ATP synthase subunit I [Chlamydiae bacterium CG10_big_fil_rev_8_21_14_0_10_42_34]|nr:MAG: V-type ATP synthase subunit I [Chlamydiae bacterium CG10_big_fil_rev_8_21_14_0_10_42_34]
MIVDLHKYLLIGSRSEMDRFFALAQKAGFMEFIGLSHKKALEMPNDAKTIISAIKIVRAYAAPSDDPYVSTLDPVRLSEKIINLNDEHEKLLEEQRIISAEISRVSAFGNFSRNELDRFEVEGKRVVQFFCMKSDQASEITFPPEVIYVGTEYDLSYFVSINKEPAQYPKMIEIIIDRPVGVLKERLTQVKMEIAKHEKEVFDSAKALRYLQEGLLDYLNDYHLQLAKHDAGSPLGDSLFAIEAWVPKTRIKAMFGLLSGLDVHAEEIAIDPKDKIPTYQENKGVAKLGEDLVHVYDTPAASDKDPSLWVLVFFSLFFAMIVSDAGYGLIYLSIGLFLKWKYKKASGFFRRFIKLILIVSTSCIVWGCFTASFFGIEIGPNNPYRKVSLLHYMASKKAEYHMKQKDDVYEEYVKQYPQVATAKDGHEFLVKAAKKVDGKMRYPALSGFYDNILLEFSLFIGMIHISFSFIRYMTRNWTGIGWIFFMIGGYLYFPSFLDATSFLNFMGVISKPISTIVGEQMLYTGLGLVLVISLLMKKKWGALHELTNAIQVFADVLSYIRLYALALAGMIMASTFNELGLEAGFVGGFFIIIIGHITNLTLTIMSGVIHGLRLNFLEWYHYSFEGGGRLFDPLRIRKVK